MQEAMKWFIRAARQGDKTAQHNLGVHYATQELAQQAAAEEAASEEAK
jgi:TPR repeat protein